MMIHYDRDNDNHIDDNSQLILILIVSHLRGSQRPTEQCETGALRIWRHQQIKMVIIFVMIVMKLIKMIMLIKRMAMMMKTLTCCAS